MIHELIIAPSLVTPHHPSARLEVLVARLAVHLATAADVRQGLLQLGDAVAGTAQYLLGAMAKPRYMDIHGIMMYNWGHCNMVCVYIFVYIQLIKGSLEAKLPTIWRDENAGRLSRSSDMEKVRKEKMQVREKGRDVANHCVFPVFCGPGGSKSRLAKAAGAETSGQMRHEKLHPVVARSTFCSQKWQNTSCSDHFWKLRCRKRAQCCGAKHIWK